MAAQSHTLEVWGDFACFTRPEMKVERYSYPCPTPSAARGIFEAIYFKPQFYWQVDRIELLAIPKYIPLRRNEVKDKIGVPAVKKWMAGKEQPQPIFADADESITGDAKKAEPSGRPWPCESHGFGLRRILSPGPVTNRSRRPTTSNSFGERPRENAFTSRASVVANLLRSSGISRLQKSPRSLSITTRISAGCSTMCSISEGPTGATHHLLSHFSGPKLFTVC